MSASVQELPGFLRGNYAAAAPDGTLPAESLRYSAADHATWRTLYQHQAALLPGHAASSYRTALARLPFADGVPDLAATSALLRAATGFSLVPVPGLIPDAPFFAHLAARRFPVTAWIRRPEELDYIVEPDIFHDAFGHVPLLTEPDFAEVLEAYGRLGEQAMRLGALKPLARFYWHMIEFGLIREAGPGGGALRAYGAGILSSSAETRHAVTGTAPRRLRFDLWRVLRSDYFIDDLQPTYFVIESFAELFAAMRRLPALLEAARDAAPIPPGAAADGDHPIR
ncbi:phenylalanine 4-monooxygenase [Siccirubricoccus sp. KC 17139]|uniref:phenylalanine 4-monooxygenase n=1 Tax=Siccirubricoccus soli TaxID=2899147 RepID=A0ABT1CYZ7_9PROT|nr:phenylalanine 4-monooxygenase [Siccirubricoccus soli]MCO6414896.1 phenylalanine 4-monooxygenase [Siccirubricoccus soli]MCP2681026.1 phenylalanine 4-monooxygenase [Siccirubricoccus soli]